MRVLVADEFSKRHLDTLKTLGLMVEFRPELTAAQLPEASQHANILVVRSTEVTGEVFERGRALSLVIRAGAGVNTIDVRAASEHGVYVANCPGQNAVAVAELTMGLILALDRKIPDGVSDLRAGKWDKKRYGKARGLLGRTMGLVGVGNIGAAVGRRAQAFGMRVVGYSRTFDAARAQSLGFERADSLVALARQADVLTVHVPADASTKQLVAREVLAALPSQAMFINTSRADVVDHSALMEELRNGRLWVGTDVFPDEPKSGQADFVSELAAHPRVYGTHHIGASTEQAQEAIADEAVRIIERFLLAGDVPNCVNIAHRTPAQYQLIVRHQDRVGVLANVLSEIREAGINAQEIENTVFEGAAAACCKIQLDSRPSDGVLQRIRARVQEVIFADLVELRR